MRCSPAARQHDDAIQLRAGRLDVEQREGQRVYPMASTGFEGTRVIAFLRRDCCRHHFYEYRSRRFT